MAWAHGAGPGGSTGGGWPRHGVAHHEVVLVPRHLQLVAPAGLDLLQEGLQPGPPGPGPAGGTGIQIAACRRDQRPEMERPCRRRRKAAAIAGRSLTRGCCRRLK